MLPDHIEQELDAKLFPGKAKLFSIFLFFSIHSPKIFSIRHYESGNVLNVTDLKVELGPRPDAEVKEDGEVELVQHLGVL